MKNICYFIVLSFLLLSCEYDGKVIRRDIVCTAAVAIEGTYICSGECVITDEKGNHTVITVSEEKDVIEKFPGAKEALYKVEISGGDFRELEIGALSGLVLRTATAEVSDTLYPVLEEYLFETNEKCRAIGFTKSVRNPDPKNFKACVIYCDKQETE